MESKYALELWTRNGDLLADLSSRATNRRVVLTRNDADQVQWTLDLNELERWAALQQLDPKTLIIPGQTEVRIRRGEKYLAGGQIDYSETVLDDTEQVVNLRASGFLNLFKDRYTGTTPAGTVTESYTATEATSIAAQFIEETQALTNGDFGIIIGTLATVGTHDRTYERTNGKNLLQDLTTVETAPFDFEFTPDKVFNTYDQIGSSRPDVVFEWPRNIVAITVPNDATGLANEVIALGSGFGSEAAAIYTADDTASQANYQLRQKVIQSNATDNSDNGLTDAANAEVATWSWPLEIPAIKVDGNLSPYVTDYGIGDWVRVRITGHPFLDHIDAMYRIEMIDLTITDNDDEQVILSLSR